MLDKCLTDLDAEIDALTQAGSWSRGCRQETLRQGPPPSPLRGLGTHDGVFRGMSI